MTNTEHCTSVKTRFWIHDNRSTRSQLQT